MPTWHILINVHTRVHQQDYVQGKWCVDGPELNVWVDASSLPTRVLLKQDGAATGSIQISNGRVTKCVAISINEPDFTATFDHQSQA